MKEEKNSACFYARCSQIAVKIKKGKTPYNTSARRLDGFRAETFSETFFKSKLLRKFARGSGALSRSGRDRDLTCPFGCTHRSGVSGSAAAGGVVNARRVATVLHPDGLSELLRGRAAVHVLPRSFAVLTGAHPVSFLFAFARVGTYTPLQLMRFDLRDGLSADVLAALRRGGSVQQYFVFGLPQSTRRVLRFGVSAPVQTVLHAQLPSLLFYCTFVWLSRQVI